MGSCSRSHAIATGSDVKNRDGMAILLTFSAKLTIIRSTAERPTNAIRETWHSRLNAPRASLVTFAVPVMSTRSGRLWSPLSLSTVAIAADASGPVISIPGIQRTTTTFSSTVQRERAVKLGRLTHRGECRRWRSRAL